MSYHLTAILSTVESAKKMLAGITDEPDLVRILQKNMDEFTNAINERKIHEDEFTITVIGIVKAGKSSLLNSLLFDGRPILPTAASPKTAALTVLRNNDENDCSFYAKIKFVDHISEKEIHSWDKNIQDFYRQGKHIIRGKDVNDLAKKIKPYVAVVEDESRSCAEFVECVDMYLPGLHDSKGKKIRVVDTPGLDDPNAVRSSKTEKFIPETDAFIFLSGSDCFMVDSSQEYLFNLNDKSCSDKLILVGTKVDSLLDDSTIAEEIFDWDGKGNPLQHLCNVLAKAEKNKMDSTFRDKICNEIPKSDEKKKNYLSQILKQNFIFTSMALNPHAWKYDTALKSKGEKAKTKISDCFNVKENYGMIEKRLGPQVHLQLSEQELEELSGITKVQTKYEELKEAKQISFEQWVKNYIDNFTSNDGNRVSIFSRLTGEILSDLENSMQMLGKSKEEIQSKIDKDQAMLKELSGEINEILENELRTFYDALKRGKQALRICLNYCKLKSVISKATKIEEWSQEVRICLFWTKQIKHRCITDVDELKTINVIGLLNDFYAEITDKIKNVYMEQHGKFKKILSNELPYKIMSLFFEEHNFLSVEIPIVLNEIENSSWELNVNREKYIQRLRTEFPVSAKEEEEVKKMGCLFEKCKEELFEDICRNALENCEKIHTHLKQWQDDFIKKCSDRLKIKADHFIKDIQERENNQAKIQKEIDIISRVESVLQTLPALKQEK